MIFDAKNTQGGIKMRRELTTGSERSPLYLRVVALIRKLAEEQCEDSASRAYAETTSDLHEAAFVDQGLKRGRGRLCVERLVGKQCNLKGCTPPAGDHDTLWLKKGKPDTYLMQPYQLTWKDMKNLVAFCEKNGLQADVTPWPSFHFPSNVISVHIRREKWSK